MARRERTRQLIELGGLVHKAGLVDLVDDDPPTLLGGLLNLVDALSGGDRADVLAMWRRRGRRAFEASSAASRDRAGDRAATTASPTQNPEIEQ